MKRKVYDELVKWKKESNGKTAVLIEGARRVGKSYIAEEFAKKNYRSYLLVDFSEVPNRILKLFDDYLTDLDTLFMYLTSFYNTTLYERESLIIFDEIQFCPRARSAIKYLVQDGRYDYLETGSLISIRKNVKDILIPSEEETIKMNPMDFEEFLWAMDNETIMTAIKKSYDEKKPMLSILHQKATDYFKRYLIVGGMPQVVNAYIKTNSFSVCDKVKRNIISLYRKDIRKYADELNLKVEQIFDNIPSQLQKHEKKFTLTSLNQNARYRDYDEAFIWLQDAGIVNIAYNTTEPNIGLGQRRNDNSLKCYFFDTGLLLSMIFDEKKINDEEIYKKILFDKLSYNEGMIIENVVAQMLVASGRKLYFFSKYDHNNSDNTMEIDFLISKNKITSRHNIIPIEVKSTKRYTYSSLNKLKKKYKDYIGESIIIHPDNLKKDNDIIFIPIYMTQLL